MHLFFAFYVGPVQLALKRLIGILTHAAGLPNNSRTSIGTLLLSVKVYCVLYASRDDRSCSVDCLWCGLIHLTIVCKVSSLEAACSSAV